MRDARSSGRLRDRLCDRLVIWVIFHSVMLMPVFFHVAVLMTVFFHSVMVVVFRMAMIMHFRRQWVALRDCHQAV